MAPKNVTITIEDIDELNDTMRIYADGFSYPTSIIKFKELIQGNKKHRLDIEHLIRNIAISASLSNVDINDFNSIKAAVEGKPFKV